MFASCSATRSSAKPPAVIHKDVELPGADGRTFPTGRLARIWTAHAPAMARAIDDLLPRIDIVHIHELWHHPHYVAARAARRTGTPYVITIHGELDPWAIGHRYWRKRLYMALIQRGIIGRATALHAITAAEVDQISPFAGTSPITVIPNGVSKNQFDSAAPSRNSQSLSDHIGDRRIVLFMSRLHKKKGLDLLVSGFKRVAETRNDVVLVIAGPDDGGYRRQVESMVKAACIGDRTIFTGLLLGEEKVALLLSAEVFVLPSYSEGLPIAVLEAMAAGLPVLISRFCNLPEVEETGSGSVIDADAGQLAEALAKMLGDPDRQNAMGEAGRQLVGERFSWPRIANQFSQLYDGIVTNKITDSIS